MVISTRIPYLDKLASDKIPKALLTWPRKGQWIALPAKTPDKRIDEVVPLYLAQNVMQPCIVELMTNTEEIKDLFSLVSRLHCTVFKRHWNKPKCGIVVVVGVREDLLWEGDGIEAADQADDCTLLVCEDLVWERKSPKCDGALCGCEPPEV